MSDHNELGKKGEALARSFLEDKGLKILETNWRYSRFEVDIIALEDDILVFVEVKTRSSDPFGPPETFVTPAKEKRMTEAALAYLEENGQEEEIRFDVISVLIPPYGQAQIKHLEDAFFPGWG